MTITNTISSILRHSDKHAVTHDLYELFLVVFITDADFWISLPTENETGSFIIEVVGVSSACK